MQNHVKNHFSLQKKIKKVTFMTKREEKEAQFKIGDTNPKKQILSQCEDSWFESRTKSNTKNTDHILECSNRKK